MHNTACSQVAISRGVGSGWNGRRVGNVTNMYNSGGQDNKGGLESYEKL